MTSMTSFDISDGEATPVVHNMIPISRLPNAMWREELAGVPADAQVRVEAKLSKAANGLTKIRIRTFLPYLEAVEGANDAGYTAPPKIAYQLVADSHFYQPRRSELLARTNCRSLHIGTLVQPQITAMIDQLHDFT